MSDPSQGPKLRIRGASEDLYSSLAPGTVLRGVGHPKCTSAELMKQTPWAKLSSHFRALWRQHAPSSDLSSEALRLVELDQMRDMPYALLRE